MSALPPPATTKTVDAEAFEEDRALMFDADALLVVAELGAELAVEAALEEVGAE